MKPPLIALFLSLLYLPIDCARKKKCRALEGKYYSKGDIETRRCRRCEVCPAGMEWHKNATIRTSDEYGDLECLPCIPCKDGYYKDNNVFWMCSLCVQNCEGLNRYLQKPCGGVVKGHCGSCKPGYEDRIGNIEMACTPTPIETGSHKPNGIDFSLQPSDSATKKLLPASQNSETVHWPIDKVILFAGLVAGSILVLTCLIGGILYFTINKRRSSGNGRNNKSQAEDYSSSKRLLNSNLSMRSSAQGSVAADPERPQIVNDLDLELDVHSLDPVRGELQSRGISIGRGESGRKSNIRQQYPTTILSKDDQMLEIVASHVYGDTAVDKLFSKLDIPAQKLYEERHIWLTKNQSLKQYVLNVLLKWIEKAGPDATLSNLCGALHGSGCYEALIEVNKELTISSAVS